MLTCLYNWDTHITMDVSDAYTALMATAVPNSVGERFEKESTRHPPLSQQLVSLRKLIDAKMYHEFTTEGFAYISAIDPECNHIAVNSFPLCVPSQRDHSSDTSVASFVRNIIAPFRHHLNPLSFTEMVFLASLKMSSKDAVAWIEQYDTVAINKDDKQPIIEAAIFLKLIKLSNLCLCGDIKIASEGIDAPEDYISTHIDCSLNVHSLLQRVKYTLEKMKGNQKEAYVAGMLFLAYTPLGTLRPIDGLNIVYDITRLLLLTDGEYDYGELLYHPGCTFLRENEKYAWILDIVNAFNEGSWALFETAMKSPHVSFSENDRSVLQDKMKLMSLMELSFEKLHEKKITFEEVKEFCRIHDQQVELVLMKAQCDGLIEGSIDGISKEFNLRSVKPRILDRQRLAQLCTRYEKWVTRVDGIVEELTTQTVDLTA
eukprot:GHVO01009853.1.p1 GENE.GHVO01009853.1~~GHVO01009853.1.p1  ORF type:complete len:430 (+),score=102.10 GHVO01009853.1:585-1874(+)